MSDFHYREVTRGLETLASMEAVPTRTEGIFVMPESRINILSTYVFMPDQGPVSLETTSSVPVQANLKGDGKSSVKECSQQLEELQQRFDALAAQMQDMRSRKLPG